MYSAHPLQSHGVQWGKLKSWDPNDDFWMICWKTMATMVNKRCTLKLRMPRSVLNMWCSNKRDYTREIAFKIMQKCDFLQDKLRTMAEDRFLLFSKKTVIHCFSIFFCEMIMHIIIAIHYRILAQKRAGAWSWFCLTVKVCVWPCWNVIWLRETAHIYPYDGFVWKEATTKMCGL